MFIGMQQHKLPVHAAHAFLAPVIGCWSLLKINIFSIWYRYRRGLQIEHARSTGSSFGRANKTSSRSSSLVAGETHVLDRNTDEIQRLSSRHLALIVLQDRQSVTLSGYTGTTYPFVETRCTTQAWHQPVSIQDTS
jgi:hypothetical protein